MVLLDRDGVINVNRDGYVRSWADFEFLPGAVDGLALLHGVGARVVIVTNQSALNRGLTTPDAIEDCHRRMRKAVETGGGEIEAVFVCPHRPDEKCACRKPAPGLLLRAAEELDFAIEDAILVGDHRSDLEAAQRAGCASILTLSGRTSSADPSEVPSSCIGVVPDLPSAVHLLRTQALDAVGATR